MHRTLAEEMVQTEDSPFFKNTEQDAVEFPGGSPIAAKGFSTITRAPLPQPDFPSCSTTTPKLAGGIAR
jgi:hypothetical protein